MKEERLQIEYVSVDKLTPYAKNARKHQTEDVDAIKKSIENFGFDDPIGVWGEKNMIVEGHGRLLAAKQLGMEEVPVIHLDHLTDEQRRAYALAHNKTAELSEWDFEKLKKELSEMSFDMEDFGFWTPDVEEQQKKNETIHKEKTTQEKQIICPRCGSDHVRKVADDESKD